MQYNIGELITAFLGTHENMQCKVDPQTVRPWHGSVFEKMPWIFAALNHVTWGYGRAASLENPDCM